MKRIVKIAAVVILVPAAVLAVIVGVTFMSRMSIVDGFQAGDVRIVKDGIVSLGIVPAGADGVMLIDAGNDKSGRAILAELARRKLDANNVAAIFLTHGHPDHTGATRLFPHAEVMALAREVGLIEGAERSHGPITRFMPASSGGKVTRALHDDETVTIGDTDVRVFAVPGHTAGSAAYVVHGVLFMGDAADADKNGKLIGSPWIFSDSQAEDEASLVRLSERLEREHVDVRTIAFAHSGVRTDGLAPLLAFAAAAKR